MPKGYCMNPRTGADRNLIRDMKQPAPARDPIRRSIVPGMSRADRRFPDGVLLLLFYPESIQNSAAPFNNGKAFSGNRHNLGLFYFITAV